MCIRDSTEAVGGPFGPAWVEDALLPLAGNVEPGRGVEFEIVAGGAAEAKEGRDDQQRNTQREAEGEEPAAKSGRGRAVERVGGQRHSMFTGL